MAGFRVGVVGATGLVGRTILQVLQERRFPIAELRLLASERSAGTTIAYEGDPVPVQRLQESSFDRCDVVFFSAGASVSRQFAPIAARRSALVVDNSSAFRMNPDVPLVVPEVNGRILSGYSGIVANPNCSTIQMVVVLDALHRVFGLESVIVSTYQSVSGSGAKGVRALEHEVEHGRMSTQSPFAHPIAFNALPHIDVFDAEGWTVEERKMINETRKILDLPSLHVVPTTVRVPVRVGHSESVYARFARTVSREQAHRALEIAPGVVVEDDPAAHLYPLAVRAEGRDEVFVGRIRRDPDDDHAITLWIVADNLRKGAATNSVQIAQYSMLESDPSLLYA